MFVNVRTSNILKRGNITNIIGVFRGIRHPDRYIIIGAQRDSNNFGAMESGVGTALLLEIGRLLSKLRETGWKPSRTIMLMSWDASAAGYLGSSEYIEELSLELSSRAVIYVNLQDVMQSSQGTFHVTGSPLLMHAIKLARQRVAGLQQQQPHTNTAHNDDWSSLDGDNVWDERLQTTIPRLHYIDGVGDYVPWYSRLGVPSIDLKYTSKASNSYYPTYHTEYDLPTYLEDNIDCSKQLTTSMLQVVISLLLLMTDSFVLPLHPVYYSDVIEEEFVKLNATYNDKLVKHNMSLALLESSVKTFHSTTVRFSDEITEVLEKDVLIIPQYNDAVVALDKTFVINTNTDGEAGNPAPARYRHLLFGPSPSNANVGVAFPTLRTALYEAALPGPGVWSPETVNNIKNQLVRLIQALNRATQLLRHSMVKPVS